MKQLLMAVLIIMASCNISTAQQKVKKPAQLKKVSQQYNFSESWVWDYTNADGSGTCIIYRDPKTGYWLFTVGAYGNSSEMTEWIIGKPNGEYIFLYQDAAMNATKSLHTERINFPTISRLPTHYKANNKTQNYGDPITGFPLFKAMGYTLSYEKTMDKSVLSFAPTKYNFAAIYNFNKLNIDAKLPIHFPTDIPYHYLAAYEYVTYAGGSATYTFNNVSDTEYYIDLNDYK